MNEAENMAELVRRALPKVRAGSLRFWGEWFGKPYDNRHVLKRCDAEGNLLRLFFEENEKLLVWSPDGLTVDQSTFRISSAERVRWEWYSYEPPWKATNLYFEDFVKSPQGILASTNIDWYKPKFKPDSSQAAVEIL